MARRSNIRFLNLMLPCGTLLGDATAVDLERAATFYLALAKDMRKRCRSKKRS